MSKWPLIFESAAVIRIGMHLVGEEHDQHVIRVAHRVSCTTTFRGLPTRLKSGICSRDEILAPSDRPARPSFWAASFSLH
jgi:hypothetical protein